jgi:hypothetical protein
LSGDMPRDSQMSRPAAVAAMLMSIACSRTPKQEQPQPNQIEAVPQARAQRESGRENENDRVRSVYPVEGAAQELLAVRLCAALQEAPQVRRAACSATTPGALATGECVRTLSAALRSGAVSLTTIDVDRCVEAMDRATEGCGWVGPNTLQPAGECQGIVQGVLTEGSRCRSSLECIEGLRCHGLGPTVAGTCGTPRDEGAACGGSVDPLAVYARQNDYELHHPECRGWCNRRTCAVR